MDAAAATAEGPLLSTAASRGTLSSSNNNDAAAQTAVNENIQSHAATQSDHGSYSSPEIISTSETNRFDNSNDAAIAVASIAAARKALYNPSNATESDEHSALVGATAEKETEARRKTHGAADDDTPHNSGVDDAFVTVELLAPSSSPMKSDISSPAKTRDEEIGRWQQEQQHFPAAYVPSQQQPTMTTALNNIASTSPLHISSQTTDTTTTRRRKILHHPLLSHFSTKILPQWNRFTSVAASSVAAEDISGTTTSRGAAIMGTCDILFNCKYSMRQVEDEVREEGRRRRLENGMCYDDNYNIDDDNVYSSAGGREDGYGNVSLNDDVVDYPCQKGEEGERARCEPPSGGEMEHDLACFSMLDQDEEEEDDDDEEEDD